MLFVYLYIVVVGEQRKVGGRLPHSDE